MSTNFFIWYLLEPWPKWHAQCGGSFCAFKSGQILAKHCLCLIWDTECLAVSLLSLQGDWTSFWRWGCSTASMQGYCVPTYCSSYNIRCNRLGNWQGLKWGGMTGAYSSQLPDLKWSQEIVRWLKMVPSEIGWNSISWFQGTILSHLRVWPCHLTSPE